MVISGIQGEFVYDRVLSDELLPNIEYLHQHGININSQPSDWYELFIPKNRRRQDNNITKCTFEDITAWKNTKAMMMNAGVIGGMYSQFHKFTVAEIKQHLALYMSNGLSPSLGFERNFSSQTEDIFNGNNLCHSFYL